MFLSPSICFRLKMFAFYFCITLPRFTLPPLVCCEQFSTLLPTLLTNEAFGNFVYIVRWRKLDAILNFSKKYGLKLCKLEQRNTRRKITILQHSGGMLLYLHSCFNKTSRCSQHISPNCTELYSRFGMNQIVYGVTMQLQFLDAFGV